MDFRLISASSFSIAQFGLAAEGLRSEQRPLDQFPLRHVPEHHFHKGQFCPILVLFQAAAAIGCRVNHAVMY